MTDKSIIEKLVWAAAKDFEVETGYFVVDSEIMDVLEFGKDLEGVRKLLVERAHILEKHLVFRVYKNYDMNLRTNVVNVEWRTMTKTERIRAILYAEANRPGVDDQSIDERLDRVMPKIRTVLDD